MRGKVWSIIYPLYLMGNEIEFSSQAVTEGNMKSDFLFHSHEVHHDFNFSTDSLVSLVEKTTCKDWWR